LRLPVSPSGGGVIAERLLRPLGHALAEDAWRVRFTWIIEPMQRLETAGQAWPLKAPSRSSTKMPRDDRE
jgi:hypothetical protein